MTISEFFYMGGFGYYIWMSMGMTLIIMLGEVFVLKHQRKTRLKQIARMIRIRRNQ